MSGIDKEEEERDELTSSGNTAHAHGMFHSHQHSFTRTRSATDLDVEDEDEVFKVFASLEAASDYLKIPEATLKKYILFAGSNGGMLMSFRDKMNLQTITKRRSDLSTDYFNKPGPVKTKMNSTFPKGHIPRDRSLCTTGVTYDLADNSYSGTFPAGSVVDKDCKKLLALLQLHEEKYHEADKITEVRKIGNRICYKESVVQYDKGESGYVLKKIEGQPLTASKHYIQEVESIHSVLKNIARGIYSAAEIEDGRLKFKFAEKQMSIKISDLPAEIQPNLEKLLNIAKTTATAMAFIDASNVAGLKQRGAMLNKMDTELFAIANGLDDSACPIWYNKSTASANEELPVMVMAGDNGYEIASDLDILQLPAPFGLPESMHTLCITSKKPQLLSAMFDKAILDLKELIASLKDSDQGKQVFIDLLKEVEATQKYYFEDLDAEKLMDKLSVLGTTNVYGITKQYIFNRDNNFDPNTPWPHGADDLHPAPTPEKFGAVIMLNDGTVSYIGNEKAYVLYLLHDPSILQNASNELSIHPHWLTTNDTQHEHWKNIVYIQGLYAKKLDIARGIAPPGEQYFKNLRIKSSLDSRKKDVIDAAMAAIDLLQDKVNSVDAKEIDTKLKEAYTGHLKTAEDTAIMSDILSKVQSQESGVSLG